MFSPPKNLTGNKELEVKLNFLCISLCKICIGAMNNTELENELKWVFCSTGYGREVVPYDLFLKLFLSYYN